MENPRLVVSVCHIEPSWLSVQDLAGQIGSSKRPLLPVGNHLFPDRLRPAINLELSSIATLPSSQKVLARPRWQQAITPSDYAALTPLIWSHVNLYGRFDLDMNARIALA